jgi:hypothetical protein
MALEMKATCDAPGCRETLESEPFSWGRGRDRFLLLLLEHKWTCNDSGELFCPSHVLCAGSGDFLTLAEVKTRATESDP